MTKLLLVIMTELQPLSAKAPPVINGPKFTETVFTQS